MPLNKLNPIKIQKIKKAGLYSDGGGLYVQARKSTSNDASKNKTAFAKSYIFRYSIDGKERWMGLGSVNDIPLDQAREDAAKYRGLKKRSIDPLQHNQRLASQDAADADEDKTFKECTDEFIEGQKSGWKNRKHESQWRNTLETYAYPVIGDMFVRDIQRKHVLKILKPIWDTKTETASRVRQRLENILDYAVVHDCREQGVNPARWKGNLDKVFPKRSDVQKVKHFAALPYKDLPKFYEILKEQHTVASLALAFTIITATRVGEARNAAWDEIDFKGKKWTIPAARMKAGKEHEVPMSPEAIRILKKAHNLPHDKYIFTSHLNRPISDSAVRKLLQQYHPDMTVHGLRSSFRDWAAEMTSYPREVCEHALAHQLKDKSEAAYQRRTLFPKRQRLMDAWADYCLSGEKTSKITPINKVAKTSHAI